MKRSTAAPSTRRIERASVRRVLNAGCGVYAPHKLHRVFSINGWQEVRFDIDPQTKPDAVGSIVDMRSNFESRSFDALWCSHVLEHLHAHEVVAALAEFRRILNPKGFALITGPDLEAVASLVVQHGLDYQAYISPAGPITPLDMMFGHTASISRGRVYMAHNTGFTAARLGKLLLEVGFSTIFVKRDRLDLWALALMERAETEDVQRQLQSVGLAMVETIE